MQENQRDESDTSKEKPDRQAEGVKRYPFVVLYREQDFRNRVEPFTGTMRAASKEEAEKKVRRRFPRKMRRPCEICIVFPETMTLEQVDDIAKLCYGMCLLWSELQ